MCLAPGKDTSAAEDALRKGLELVDIEVVTSDLSPAFIAAAMAFLPQSARVFGCFHVKQLLNKTLDTARRQERASHAILKKSRYLFIRDHKNLTSKQIDSLTEIEQALPLTGKAYRLKELFDTFWEQPTTKDAQIFAQNWIAQARETGPIPFIDFGKTLIHHWDGIIDYTLYRISNGIVEALNVKLQLLKRRDRGFRTFQNFRTIIMITCGKLDIYPLIYT